MTMNHSLSLKSKILTLAVTVVLIVLALEGMLRITMPDWRDFYSGRFMRQLQIPGYGTLMTGTPGFDGYFAQNNGDFRIRIKINEFGLRNPEPVEAADGAAWFIGDSFTFGWGVEQTEMYSSVAAKLAGVQSYNVASPGTDTCGYQMLFSRMPQNIKPRAVLIGFVIENDFRLTPCPKEGRLNRRARETGPEFTNPTMYKVMLTKYSAIYNFLAVSLKRIDVIRNALISTGVVKKEHGRRAFLRPEQVDAAVSVNAGELKWIKDRLPSGTPFGILLIPARFELMGVEPKYHAARIKFKEELIKLGIDVIDPFQAFFSRGMEKIHFIHDGHWSPLGHEVAGKAAADWLRRELK